MIVEGKGSLELVETKRGKKHNQTDLPPLRADDELPAQQTETTKNPTTNLYLEEIYDEEEETDLVFEAGSD